MAIGEILARKRDGLELSSDEISEFIHGVVDGSVKDYQTTAWLMAVFLRGMTYAETRDLTLAMRDSGKTVQLPGIPNRPSLDKHSTGGVGDKTTLVVVPILAACGVPILKMSGRGLGFSGGTVDKLELIPGFQTELTIERAIEQVGRIGAALIGQSADLAPADKILYGLRDVTATIESLPLIASSIMSKKLAAGADRILLDVKAGRGAFMKTRAQSEELARLLIRLGNDAGRPTTALLSPMDEPLGRMVGNALEVAEATRTLMSPEDAEPAFVALCRELAAYGLLASGRCSNLEQAAQKVDSVLSDGLAARKFADISGAQGGPDSCSAIIGSLPRAPIVIEVAAQRSGVITVIDAEKIGRLAMIMGAGRQIKTDPIDPAVGIAFERKVGASVAVGDVIAALHCQTADTERTGEFAASLLAACAIDNDPKAIIDQYWTAYLQ